MTKKVSIKEFTPELQRAINKEVSTLKNSKRILSKTELSEAAKVFLDDVVKGTWTQEGAWTQREDGKIDVKGNVEATRNRMLHLFMGKEIFFGEVTGAFDCSFTKITSLKGAPEKVNGYFSCWFTDITSLEGAPRVVGGSFHCSHTNITSLKGAPRVVGGFDCSETKITSLIGVPGIVGGDLDCSKTKITSLEGAPREVGGDFNCSHTDITSLKGSPKEVGGDFDCSWTKITSLKGSPEVVGEDFNCTKTKITSLEGAPAKVGRDFSCTKTLITSLEGIGEVKGHTYSDVGKSSSIVSVKIATAALRQFILDKAKVVQKINNEAALDDISSAIEGTVKLSAMVNKQRFAKHIDENFRTQIPELLKVLQEANIKEVEIVRNGSFYENMLDVQYAESIEEVMDQEVEPQADVYSIVNLPIPVATEINTQELGIFGKHHGALLDIFGDLDEATSEGRALIQIEACIAELKVEEDED